MHRSPFYPRFLPVGDAALTVEFGNLISPEINDAVIALDVALASSEIIGISETVPSYRSLLVCYDPVEISFQDLVHQLQQLLHRRPYELREGQAVWNVPVLYDLPYGVDLPEVAERVGLSEEEVIRVHTSVEYQVYMIGFAPGLPYLGGLPPALHLSRQVRPRPSVPPGAVMIGGIQAGIVPAPVPSAWYILGQTPLRPFDPGREDPFLFRAGDKLRFRRIERAEFDTLATLAQNVLLGLVRDASS